jgi:N-acetylglucosamine kinase-like BadF-type ATPase
VIDDEDQNRVLNTIDMTRYFLGTDTGGTKSHALVADETGQALGFGEGGPGNPQGIGHDGLTALLRGITDQALRQAGIKKGQIAGGGFGIAGYDWPSQHERLLHDVAPLGLEAPVEFANDTIVGLLAGASEGWGVAVVAGTSCNCRGRDQNKREGRVTGYGMWIGEQGGGYELVTRALRAVAFEWTCRGPATRLTQAFIELVGARDIADLLEKLTTEQVAISSEAAPLVFRVAAEGDPAAIEAVRWAGRELGDMANGVIRQLHFEPLDFEVVLVGSLYDGGPLLVEPMRETIHAIAPQARLVRLAAPPVIGGVLLGMEQAGVNGTRVRERLAETTKELLRSA